MTKNKDIIKEFEKEYLHLFEHKGEFIFYIAVKQFLLDALAKQKKELESRWIKAVNGAISGAKKIQKKELINKFKEIVEKQNDGDLWINADELKDKLDKLK